MSRLFFSFWLVLFTDKIRVVFTWGDALSGIYFEMKWKQTSETL